MVRTSQPNNLSRYLTQEQQKAGIRLTRTSPCTVSILLPNGDEYKMDYFTVSISEVQSAAEYYLEELKRRGQAPA